MTPNHYSTKCGCVNLIDFYCKHPADIKIRMKNKKMCSSRVRDLTEENKIK